MRILNTDTCIELLRGNQRVIERRSAVRDLVLTTWITTSELYFGAARSSAPEENSALVEEFLSTIDVVEYDRTAAKTFGHIKALLAFRGESLPDADLLIAAITLAHGATLVTGNTAHFERIPGVRLENWIRD